MTVIPKEMIKLDLDDNLIKDKPWYVAFSGGPDSACLLYLLIKKREEIEKKYQVSVKLSAIHVNHNLRQSESKRDQEFCRRLCEKYDIEFLPYDVDVNNYAKEEKLTVEQAARVLRYEIFDDYSYGCVFLGHNKDDNAETVFLNILRGSGVQGLCGMQKVSDHYFRPLLDYTKKEILEFNRDNGIEYVIDSTNQASYYMRNYIRNEIIPALNEKTNKDIVGNLIALADIATQTQSYINKQIDAEWDKRVTAGKDHVLVDVEDFADMDQVISSGLLRKAIRYVKKGLKDVEKKHIEIVHTLIFHSQSGAVVDLKDGIRVLLLQNNRVKIYKQSEEDYDFCVAVNIEGDTFIESRDMNVRAFACIFEGGDEYTEQRVFLDYETVKQGLVIRNRKSRDFIYPAKGNGKKTLKKYFIDNKVDSDLRDRLFVLAIENEIVYIENKEIGKRFSPVKGSNALRLEFVKNERTV